MPKQNIGSCFFLKKKNCFELFLFAMSLHKLVLQVGSFVERAPVGRLPGARTRR